MSFECCELSVQEFVPCHRLQVSRLQACAMVRALMDSWNCCCCRFFFLLMLLVQLSLPLPLITLSLLLARELSASLCISMHEVVRAGQEHIPTHFLPFCDRAMFCGLNTITGIHPVFSNCLGRVLPKMPEVLRKMSACLPMIAAFKC